ncbi:unnamed protein product [Peronospora belbahrii]|uniref:Uncharacterized protein n=1 Tax=Peronospora belbahrii TaxID=622444 RepID=A0AAU9KYU2_9STRA|nr:unnamed protein product [Peronospora belbahrii]CAH0515735.1 unnamed protein product [Peronospora belbahrii]
MSGAIVRDIKLLSDMCDLLFSILFLLELQYHRSRVCINGNHETITSAGHLNIYPYKEDIQLEAEKYLGYIKRVYSPITEEAKAALHTQE